VRRFGKTWGKGLFSSEGKYVRCPWSLLNGVGCLVGRKMSWFGKRFGCERVCLVDAFVYRLPRKILLRPILSSFLRFLAPFMLKSGVDCLEC
jgi:hypothetical protein